MEIYSTTLWHLQKEVTLSALAQDLVETDRTSPQVRKTAILERSDFLLYVHKPNVLHQCNRFPVILNHSHWCFCCFYSIFCFCFVFVAYCLLGVSYYAVLVSEWVREWVSVTRESEPTTNSADFDPMFPDLRVYPGDGVFFRVFYRNVA